MNAPLTGYSDVDSLLPDVSSPHFGEQVGEILARYTVVPSTQASADDAMSTYMAQLRRIPSMTDDEQRLVAMYHHVSRCPDAAHALVLANLRLVVKIAREMRWHRSTLLELIQQGNVGLAEAVRRFDPTRGVKFSSYASYWVRAMIYNYLMSMSHLVRVGNTRAGRKLFYNLNKVRRQLVDEHGDSPSHEAIAEELGVPVVEVERVARILDAEVASLDAPAPGHDTGLLSEYVSDSSAPTPEDLANDNAVRGLREAFFDAFRESLTSPRERAIWDARLASEDPETLHDIGEEFGVSRERVRQIESRLKARLRRAWLRENGRLAQELALA